LLFRDVTTIVYIDGFNLYYRAAKPSRHKWLNVAALAEAALPSTSKIVAINYYTARVSARVDPGARRGSTPICGRSRACRW
jgi:hypothetical protein